MAEWLKFMIHHERNCLRVEIYGNPVSNQSGKFASSGRIYMGYVSTTKYPVQGINQIIAQYSFGRNYT